MPTPSDDLTPDFYNATTLNYDEQQRLPSRTVQTVMDCSSSDADFFEYFKGQRERPSRAKEGMTLSANTIANVKPSTPRYNNIRKNFG